MSSLALVTGASSGIGKAFAERLAATGHDLIVVGRRRDRLEALAASLPDVAVQVVAADLSTDDGVDTVAELCASQPLTVLVNNAGVAHYMQMADLPAEKARELVHVKVVAPTMLTRAALAGMVTRGTGTIVNVAGMIAFSGLHRRGRPRAVAPSTREPWPTRSPCRRLSTPSWREPACMCMSSAPESWPPNSTRYRAWICRQCLVCLPTTSSPPPWSASNSAKS